MLILSPKGFFIMEENHIEDNHERTPVFTTPKKSKKIKIATGFLSVVLVLSLAGNGALAWLWNQRKADVGTEKAKSSGLQTQVASLNTQLADAKKAAATASATNASAATATATCAAISASLKANIAAAINTMNTAALEGYMASKVNVVYAATEYGGNKTPAQAVAALSYLNNATAPWDFNLSASILSSYGNGSYSQYFLSNSYVGKSANGYVVSFNFDCTGKINGEFVAASENLLQ